MGIEGVEVRLGLGLEDFLFWGRPFVLRGCSLQLTGWGQELALRNGVCCVLSMVE